MLLLHWTKVHQEASAYWISLGIARKMARTATPLKESYRMRGRLLLSQDGPVNKLPVLVPIVVANCPFLAIFDYRYHTAHVLGQNKGRTGLAMWHNWNGPSLWAWVTALFGWESHPKGVSLFGRDLL